jgi:two-component system sensor histidine kinase/response regulator
MDDFMNFIEERPQVEKKPSVLLIEDDIFCQKAQTHCLTELGYDVELAPNAETAIQRVENNAYDLIVLDLGLPDLSGELVIRAIREFLPNQQTPLIVATAHADGPMQQKCLYLGADVVFIKPFNKQTLARAIEFCHDRIAELAKTNY